MHIKIIEGNIALSKPGWNDNLCVDFPRRFPPFKIKVFACADNPKILFEFGIEFKNIRRLEF